MRTYLIGSLIALFCFSLCPAQDYTALQNTLINFYRYQRAGLNPTANATGNPYNPFYTQPASADGKYPHSNDAYDGGWYDAGDFVKFGLPQGYAVYALLLGYDVWPDCYDDASSWNRIGTPNSIPDVLDEAKVATDYLIKCVVSSSQVVLDIGNGIEDHKSLNESGYDNSNRLNRRAVQIWCSGADAPGFYAAALALMSKLYAKYDAAYAATCLVKAKEAFTFCTKNQKLSGKQTDNNGQPFYSTVTWQDKMALGAVELFRATNDSSYLTWAKDLMPQVAAHYDAVGYAHCGDFVALRLYQLGLTSFASNWMGDVSGAISKVVGGNSLVTGASVNATNWAVCRTAISTGFSAGLLYMVTGDKQYRDFALQQLKWVAGLSPYSKSYITQYGSGFPNQPHHRNDLNLASVARITGGLVSGPVAILCTGPVANCNWTFVDSRDRADNTEPALDYNAPAVGAATFARWYAKPTTVVRIETALKSSADNVDFNVTAQVTISATLDKSTAWKVVVEGVTSRAVKSYTGTGTAISVNWIADADVGSFMAGEQVTMRLEVANLWTVQVPGMSQTAIFLVNTKAQQFLADDKEVDNFNDTSMVNNLLGGKWSGFSDLSQSVAGGASTAPALALDGGGKDATKGMLFRLARVAGATTPYCGIRTTFNAAGTAANVGPVQSIVFDIKPVSDTAKIWVELEQPSITDKAQYGFLVKLGLMNKWYRIRVPVSSLAQPAWKTATQPLNLGAITALRFSGYGLGNERFILDNVRMQGLTVSGSAVTALSTAVHAKAPWRILHARAGSLTYALDLPPCERGPLLIDIIDSRGRVIAAKVVPDFSGSARVSFNRSSWAPGVYMIRHRGQNNALRFSFMALMNE